MEVDSNTLSLTPFPSLRWDNCYWAGELKLLSWTGFQSRSGPYASVSSELPSDGTVGLTIAAKKRSPPTVEQITAFRYLLENESQIARSVLRAIFEKYLDERKAYQDAFDEYETEVPEISERDELRSLIGLSNIHILSNAHNSSAYAGLEFGCVWEVEHGLGVMTHQSRVVEVGYADASFLW